MACIRRHHRTSSARPGTSHAARTRREAATANASQPRAAFARDRRDGPAVAPLAPAPRVTRPRIEAIGRSLAHHGRQWAPPIDRHLTTRVYDRLGHTIAAIAPHLDLTALQLLMRYALWCYALDELVDKPGGPPPRDTAAGVIAVLHTRQPVHHDPLGAKLATILHDLERRDADRIWLPDLTAALADAAVAAAAHRDLAIAVATRDAATPTAEQYLRLASRHINYRSFALALLITVPAPAQLAATDRISQALDEAATAVRLANDLRTVEQDRQEQALNILDLRWHNGQPVTVIDIAEQIDQHVHAHDRLLSAMSGPRYGPAQQTLRNSLRVAVGAYRTSDLK